MNISYNFYVKKIFYACYVKNVVLPIDILRNERNKLGVKNIGNDTKLRNNNVRTKCKLVQKALHNFYNAKILSFLTLTYHKNETDIASLKKFKIIAEKYRNSRKRFALRFNLIASIYNLELI